MALGEIAYLSPWLVRAAGDGPGRRVAEARDERRLFLLCLALPPIVVFTLTPLWGAPRPAALDDAGLVLRLSR